MSKESLSPEDRAERVPLYGLLQGAHTLAEIRRLIAEEIRAAVNDTGHLQLPPKLRCPRCNAAVGQVACIK